MLFLGPKEGAELASTYPVPGPIDILGSDSRGMHDGKRTIGALDEDLGRAVKRALDGDKAAARAEALHYSSEACTERFLAGLVVAPAVERIPLAA